MYSHLRPELPLTRILFGFDFSFRFRLYMRTSFYSIQPPHSVQRRDVLTYRYFFAYVDTWKESNTWSSIIVIMTSKGLGLTLAGRVGFVSKVTDYFQGALVVIVDGSFVLRSSLKLGNLKLHVSFSLQSNFRWCVHFFWELLKWL